jgi:hypothetical protein
LWPPLLFKLPLDRLFVEFLNHQAKLTDEKMATTITALFKVEVFLKNTTSNSTEDNAFEKAAIRCVLSRKVGYLNKKFKYKLLIPDAPDSIIYFL